MDDELEKSQDCYYFPGIRDFWKKYKSNAEKNQHDDHHRRGHQKPHISSINNKVKPGDDCKTIPHAFEEEFFKATHEKMQDANHLRKFQKVNKSGNGVEELKEMSQKHIHNNNNNKTNNHNHNHNHNQNYDYDYDNQHNNCFKSIILLSVNKKKKVPSLGSSFDLPKSQTMERLDVNLPNVRGFNSTPSFGRSRSINISKIEQGTKTYNTSSRAPTINRSVSTGRTPSFNRRYGSATNRATSIGRSTSDMAAKVRKRSVSRSGPMIMFSNSSGKLKPPATEKQLECTLEELYHGCVKHIKVSRDVFSVTGHIVNEEEVLTVNIKPGWKTGTKITFQGIPNEDRPGEYPGDIIFVVTEKHHSLFRRIDDDLELEIEIPLVDALTGCNLHIPSLGKEKMSLEIDEVIYPGYEKMFVGQGMPNQKNPNHKGNLKVKFLVAYPNNLSDEQRSKIFRILSNH